MPKLLQINVSANSGSTGKIAEQINQLAMSRGWEAYLAYGRSNQPCKSKMVHVGNMFQVYEHYAEHRLIDNDGLASRTATRKFVQHIKAIEPDIINLHNIHDHYLNYRTLFEYLNTLDIPIVWTHHDVWSFTGGCMYFDRVGCTRWRDGSCGKGCPLKSKDIMRRMFEKTKKHFELKKKLFTATTNITMVPVSYWMEGLLKESYLNIYPIQTIHNGIDLRTFCPTDSKIVRLKYGIGDNNYVIGVASVWDVRKGFDDFIRLAPMMPKGWRIVLVGLKDNMKEVAAKHNIIGVPRTENVGELAALYSGAELFLNLTYEDNYPTTNLEAMACGTPVLTYRTGGSVESVDDNTGWIVEQNDVEEVSKIIEKLSLTEKKEKLSSVCRAKAERDFDKNKCFEAYMGLYEKLLK